MRSSVNILLAPKNGSRRHRIEAKSVGPKEKKIPDVAPLETPKREKPKKEKKKVNNSIRKKHDAYKKSTRKRKSVSGSADNHEAPTPSFRTKKVSTPTASEQADKKKDEISRTETRSITKSITKSITNPPNPKPFNMEVAQKFFKQMAETQKVRSKKKKTEEDVTLETMPEGSINSGISSKSKKSHTTKKLKPLDPNIFKENGEPVWVVPDRKPDELVMNEDGELVKHPELTAALDEEGIELEDGKGWIQKITTQLSGDQTVGRINTDEAVQGIDPYASLETLGERSKKYFSKETVIFHTADNILHLCHNAIERFSQQEDTFVRRAPSREIDSRMRNVSKEEEEERTCIVTSVSFNVKHTYSISYDRRCPIASIQKFKRKYRENSKMCADQEKKEKEIENEKEETHQKKEDEYNRKEEVKKEE